MTTQEEPHKRGWLAKWRAPKRREQQLATLQQGFNELVDLTRSIREHMDQQVQTQKTLLDMMEHIPGAVEGLQSVGKATEQQTETLDLLRKQLEAAARNEDHMVASMQNFNKTLTLMDDMSKRTSQTVSSMADRTRESEDMLRTILERSERRLVYTIITLMVVSLSILGVGLYFGLGGRPASKVMDEPVPIMEEAETFEHKKSISDLAEERSAEPVPAIMETPITDETESEAEPPEDSDADDDAEKIEAEPDTEPESAAEDDSEREKDEGAEQELSVEEDAEEEDAPADEKPVESE